MSWLFEKWILLEKSPRRSARLRPISRQKHPCRAFNHFGDALGRRRRRGLENERQKQRGLAHLHELRSRQMAVGNRKIAFQMRLEIAGEAMDSLREHVLIVAAADLRHSLGNRHHRADRRAAARPAQQLDIGAAEFPQRGGNIAFRIEIERHFLLLEHFALDYGFEQPVLVSEIDVQRAFGDTGGASDLAHAGAVKSQIHEDFAGAVENLPPFRAVFLGNEAERSAIGCNHWFSYSAEIQGPGMPQGEFAVYDPLLNKLTEPFGQL